MELKNKEGLIEYVKQNCDTDRMLFVFAKAYADRSPGLTAVLFEKFFPKNREPPAEDGNFNEAFESDIKNAVSKESQAFKFETAGEFVAEIKENYNADAMLNAFILIMLKRRENSHQTAAEYFSKRFPRPLGENGQITDGYLKSLAKTAGDAPPVPEKKPAGERIPARKQFFKGLAVSAAAILFVLLTAGMIYLITRDDNSTEEMFKDVALLTREEISEQELLDKMEADTVLLPGYQFQTGFIFKEKDGTIIAYDIRYETIRIAVIIQEGYMYKEFEDKFNLSKEEYQNDKGLEIISNINEVANVRTLKFEYAQKKIYIRINSLDKDVADFMINQIIPSAEIGEDSEEPDEDTEEPDEEEEETQPQYQLPPPPPPPPEFD